MRRFRGSNRKSLYVIVFETQTFHTPWGTNLSSIINNLITQKHLFCNSLDFLVISHYQQLWVNIMHLSIPRLKTVILSTYIQKYFILQTLPQKAYIALIYFLPQKVFILYILIRNSKGVYSIDINFLAWAISKWRQQMNKSYGQKSNANCWGSWGDPSVANDLT